MSPATRWTTPWCCSGSGSHIVPPAPETVMLPRSLVVESEDTNPNRYRVVHRRVGSSVILDLAETTRTYHCARPLPSDESLLVDAWTCDRRCLHHKLRTVLPNPEENSPALDASKIPP